MRNTSPRVIRDGTAKRHSVCTMVSTQGGPNTSCCQHAGPLVASQAQVGTLGRQGGVGKALYTVCYILI